MDISSLVEEELKWKRRTTEHSNRNHHTNPFSDLNQAGEMSGRKYKKIDGTDSKETHICRTALSN